MSKWTEPLEWENAGAEPSEVLKKDGFKPEYKPAADTFNYFLHRYCEIAKELQGEFDKRIAVAKRVADTTSGSNIVCNYEATVEGITELYNGLEIIIIPDTASTFTSETQTINPINLNINGLGNVPVRRPLSFSTFVANTANKSGFLAANTPCRLMYHENYANGGTWLMADKQHTSAQDLYGTVPFASGGTGANNRVDAYSNLAFLGNNPIASNANDTPQKWAQLGSGHCYIDVEGLVGQSAKYAILVNFVAHDTVFQIMNTPVDGQVYTRSGNNTGWFTAWLDVRKAHSATNAKNAEKATSATRADYASEDTSKGTIDNRLVSLVNLLNSLIVQLGYETATATGTCTASDMITQGQGYRYSCDISLPTMGLYGVGYDIGEATVTAPTGASVTVSGNVATVKGYAELAKARVSITISYKRRLKLIL